MFKYLLLIIVFLFSLKSHSQQNFLYSSQLFDNSSSILAGPKSIYNIFSRTDFQSNSTIGLAGQYPLSYNRSYTTGGLIAQRFGQESTQYYASILASMDINSIFQSNFLHYIKICIGTNYTFDFDKKQSLGANILLERKNNFFLHASIPNLIQIGELTNKNYYLTGWGTLELSSILRGSLGVTLKKTKYNNNWFLDYFMQLEFYERYSLIGGRVNFDANYIGVVYNVIPKLQIGYSMNYKNYGRSYYTELSHQLNISYLIPKPIGCYAARKF